MSNFCITLPLKTEKFQEDKLNKRFEIGRKIYNSLANIVEKKYNQMIKTKEYRNIKLELNQIYKSKDTEKIKETKELCKKLNEIYKMHGFSEYEFHKLVSPIQRTFKKNIDSHTAQKIASSLWKAYQKLIFGDGEKVYYKKFDTLTSLEGKNNKAGIRFKDEIIYWNNLELKVIIDNKNLYEVQAFQNQICYNRIIRKFIRGRYKFYVQIVFKGVPPRKINKETGLFKNNIGKGDVGLDIGTQTIAICSEEKVRLYELCDKVQKQEDIKRKILRKMDRSKRKTNPESFNENGTYKKGVKWKYSKKYLKHKAKLKEIYRKQADIRKLQHEILANEIIKLGNNIYVETMNFKGLQKKVKKTDKNEKGKYKKKKRFGKSIANKAPAMLLEIIGRKLSYEDLKLEKIDTKKVKASQYNHIEKEYKKKKLSERLTEIKGLKVQRDMYSAFLIMNVNEDLESINDKKCENRFDKFIKLHDKEINRLKLNKNLSSMGI
ncbi:transposase [Candidatus Epulonipiscium fishelsonii]|uniref:Transposase n=1 Tax=Candidatus Epulonipiscium fishelsonii TaxID=77094 RepID=A0ACC8XHG3_9FIRM|nr:transposase [Epulopiscium sp. SCG-D08WGA-EpuloA1]